MIWQRGFAAKVLWDILLENNPEIVGNNYFTLFGTVFSFGPPIFRKTQRNWREEMIAQIGTPDKKQLVNLQKSAFKPAIWKTFLQG